MPGQLASPRDRDTFFSETAPGARSSRGGRRVLKREDGLEVKTPEEWAAFVNQSERQAAPGKVTKVLLVEDDYEVGSLVSDMFWQLGFEAIGSSSAGAALWAFANSRPIDLVFLDVMMSGGMNGVELAHEIRLRGTELPIPETSGFAGAGNLAAEQDGVRILSKPLCFERPCSSCRRSQLLWDGCAVAMIG